MKYLTKQIKRNSIEKWSDVMFNILEENHEVDYVHKYWRGCGFCRAATEQLVDLNRDIDWGGDPCRVDGVSCPGYEKMDGTGICHGHGRQALICAHEGEWVDALEHALIVLTAIDNAVCEWEAGA